MITTEQDFQDEKRKDTEFKAVHYPARLNLNYFLIFEQNGQKIKICLYDLKRVQRVANRNLKEECEKNC